ncbi:hypothetical protein ACUXNS_002123 [Brevibacterium pityocampae]
MLVSVVVAARLPVSESRTEVTRSMPIAQVHVSADRSAEATVDGATSHHPDLGAAMTRLTALAREGGQPVTLEIHDAGTVRTLHIDPSGRVSMQAAPLAPSQQSAPSQPAVPSQQSEIPTAAPEEPPAPEEPASSDATPPRASTPDGYPIGTPYSGPAAPGANARTRRRAQRQADRRTAAQSARSAPTRSKAPDSGAARHHPRRSRVRGLTAPTIVLAVMLVVALGAYFLPRIIGSPDGLTPQSIPAGSTNTSEDSLALEDGRTPVPGFAAQPTWESEVPATASVTATGRGVLVVDGNALAVLDPETGESRYTEDIDAPISFAVDTVIDGERALVWRTGDRAQALFDGETAPIEYTIPDDARISSAGTSVLIKEGNSLSTFTRDGLTAIPTPDPGYTPMALDGTALISAEFSGTVTATDVDTAESSEILLESPSDDLQIFRWVTAGHGKIVSLWGEPGASATSGHRIQLVVHSAADGRIFSTVSTTTDAVGEANWVRGQGYRLAVIGPYLFTVDGGLLVRNATAHHLRMAEPRGEIVPSSIDDTRYLLHGNTAWRSDANLLAVTDSGSHAIVRTGQDRVVGYPAQ